MTTTFFWKRKTSRDIKTETIRKVVRPTTTYSSEI